MQKVNQDDYDGVCDVPSLRRHIERDIATPAFLPFITCLYVLINVKARTNASAAITEMRVKRVTVHEGSSIRVFFRSEITHVYGRMSTTSEV